MRFSPAHHFICIYRIKAKREARAWLEEPAHYWSDHLTFQIHHLAFCYRDPIHLRRALITVACAFGELWGPVYGAVLELSRTVERAGLPLEFMLPGSHEHALSPVQLYMLQRCWQIVDLQLSFGGKDMFLRDHIVRRSESQGLYLF